MTPESDSTRLETVRRLAVVGTAGHIDHGKTALVRRLTGVDTDRLPEEKKRGISIDLGFAPLVTPAGVRVGIVDVPGHERFVKNMLAGVGGIDLVLLVIAADEGVMPQTREHFAIVKLLGITRGIVVVTKRDLVDPEWAALVRREAQVLLEGSPLAGAPIVEFSAVTGAGTTELLAEMDRQLATAANRPTTEAARLPVDRVFSVEGFGTVVTGTLWRGAIRTGDTLALLPSGKATRVRRVQVHGLTVDEAHAGQRTAVAIHGIDRDQVERGEWLVTPGSLKPSPVLDVRFELLPDLPRAWPSGQRVRFHLGASEIIGRLVLLEGEEEKVVAPAPRGAKAGGAPGAAPAAPVAEPDPAMTRLVLRPGGSVLAQLRLERPTVAARGDRFVIRTYSPSRTIGGGVVIEPVAEKRRRHATGIEQLAVHESGSLAARILQRLANETRPVATAHLAQLISEHEPEVKRALEGLLADHEVVAPIAGRWLADARWNTARDAIEHEVRAYAERYPARFGIAKGDLKSGLRTQVDAALFDPAFEALVTDGALEVRGERVRPAGVAWEPPAESLRALERVEAELEAAGMAVPENPAWQAKLGAAAGEVMTLGLFIGRLVRVSQDLTYTARQMETLRAKLEAHFAKSPALNVAAFKDLAAVSRKYAVPLMEHADRVGWTVRAGDERKRGGKLG
jgi:selenocysteine-specific elongation factor